MLLVIPALLALVVALLRGGSLHRLGALPFRGVGLIAASFAIQVLVYLPHLRDTAPVLRAGPAIYICALALALIGIARNVRLGPAVWVLFAGLIMNMSVIVANGGHMPVNTAAFRSVHGEAVLRWLRTDHHFENTRFADRSSRLLFFSDRFPLRTPFGEGNVYSIGDMLITAGAAAFAYGAVRRPGRPAVIHEAIGAGQAAGRARVVA